MFHLLDIIGTIAFAMSGALTAMSKKLDPFGVFIIAFVTAVGGGTLRDILIGRTPVGWMRDLTSVYVIILGFILAILFRKKLSFSYFVSHTSLSAAFKSVYFAFRKSFVFCFSRLHSFSPHTKTRRDRIFSHKFYYIFLL